MIETTGMIVKKLMVIFEKKILSFFHKRKQETPKNHRDNVRKMNLQNCYHCDIGKTVGNITKREKHN